MALGVIGSKKKATLLERLVFCCLILITFVN